MAVLGSAWQKPPKPSSIPVYALVRGTAWPHRYCHGCLAVTGALPRVLGSYCHGGLAVLPFPLGHLHTPSWSDKRRKRELLPRSVAVVGRTFLIFPSISSIQQAPSLIRHGVSGLPLMAGLEAVTQLNESLLPAVEAPFRHTA